MMTMTRCLLLTDRLFPNSAQSKTQNILLLLPWQHRQESRSAVTAGGSTIREANIVKLKSYSESRISTQVSIQTQNNWMTLWD